MLAFRAARAFTGRRRSASSRAATTAPTTTRRAFPRASAVRRAGRAFRPRSRRRSSSPLRRRRGTRAALEPHLDDLAASSSSRCSGPAACCPRDEFLEFLRELTRDAGALLVFDEIISFRVGYHGAQGRYGVTPDLTTLGKIIGGGLPVGALGGREDVMALFDPRRGTASATAGRSTRTR